MSRPAKPYYLLFLTIACTMLCIANAGHADTTATSEEWRTVTEVLDGDTLILDHHETVRLVGIQAPEIGHNDKPDEPLARDATERLRELALNRQVRLVSAGRTRDRYHRRLAQLHRKDGLWLQETLIRDGFAHVYSFPDNRTYVSELLIAEQEARQKRHGIWSLNRYQSVPHDEATNRLHEYAFIEGVIHKVSKVRDRWYVNFDKNWREDFTIFIAARHAKTIAEYFGLDTLTQLRHQPVRVRGHVFFKNGPMIRLTHPEQLEILSNTR